MNNRIKIFLGLATLTVAFALGFLLGRTSSSGNPAKNDAALHAEPAHGDEAGHEEEEFVKLTGDELEEFGVEVATAGPGELQNHLDLTGEIVPDPTRVAHIIPRFPGIVKEVRKTVGERVKKGEVLAIIESNESLSPYEVTSLIDGTVIEMHLTQGELISDKSHTFTVADLSRVWAELTVYQKDMLNVREGQTAIISAGGTVPDAEGRISYVSPVIDEASRTATARVILSNPQRLWRPGMFIAGKVLTDKSVVPIRVPKTALQTLEGQEVVFVQTNEGFQPQPVSIGRTNTKYAQIVAGLHEGQMYVTKGGFTLKAELQKESFGGGHGH